MNKKSLKKIQLNPNLLHANEQSDSCDSDLSQEDVRNRNFHVNTHSKCEKYVKIEKSSMKHVVFSKNNCWEQDDRGLKREKAEIKLSSSQLKEDVSLDRHNALQDHYEKIEKILDAMLQYMDIIKMEVTSSYRLCQLLNNLIINEHSTILNNTNSELIKKLCSNLSITEDSNIKNEIRTNLQLSEEIQGRFSEFNQRKRDYQVAAQNYRVLLENADLNSNQLKKLQRQFDGILVGYQHSRCMLDQELPELISNRTQVLMDCFAEMSSELKKIIEDRADLATLFDNLKISLNKESQDLVAFKSNFNQAAIAKE